jgi:hypothetical protein
MFPRVQADLCDLQFLPLSVINPQTFRSEAEGHAAEEMLVIFFRVLCHEAAVIRAA